MKRANPDLYQVATSGYLQKLAYIRKFIKYWGTTTVNGREVLIDRNYYFETHRQRADFKRLARMLGVWGDVKDPKMKGIKYAWFYLNPTKGDTSVFTDSIVASNLDVAIQKAEGEDTVVEMIIGPVVKVDRRNGREITSLQISTPLIDQEGIKAEILNDIGYLWNNAIISSGKPSDVYMDILARYVLRSQDVPYEIVDVSSAMVETKVGIDVRDCDADGCTTTTTYLSEYYKGYRVRIKIPPFNFTETTDLVQMVVNDIQYGGTNLNILNTIQVVGSLFNKTLVSDENDQNDTLNSSYRQPDITFNPQVWEAGAVFSSFGSRVQYLRVDFLLNREIPLVERINFLNSLIDSDYVEKSNDSGMFGALLAIVVFVVAVILTPVSGGLSLAAAIALGGTTAVVAIASAIAFGALGLAITTAVLYYAGAVELANSFAKFSKSIEPLVMIATVITMVNVVTTAIKGLAAEGSKAAAQEIAKEKMREAGLNVAKEISDEMGKALFDAMVDEIALDLVTEQFSSMVWAGVKDKFANLFTSSLTNITFNQAMKMVNFAFEKFKDNETAQLKDGIADERSRIEAYEKEQVQVNNLLMDISRGLYTPIANDCSIYANLYDKPYEWWATKYHTGCIQGNTVSAMWLADKSKP